MKIKSFKILNNPESKGLIADSYEIRSSVVALVGRNGSGKSRILEYINTSLTRFDLNKEFTFSNFSKQLENHFIANDKIYKANQNASAVNQRNNTTSKFLQPYIKYIKGHDISNLAQGIKDKNLTYENYLNQPDADLPQNEFSVLNNSALNYFLNIPNRLAYEQWKYRDNEKSFYNTKAYREFKSVQRLIKDLLGKNIDWEIDDANVSFDVNNGFGGVKGKWYLEGWPFEFAKLSDGERPLFAYALLLHVNSDRSKSKLNQSIILIDEPEQHLHPEALINLINGLKKRVCTDGQIWLATHSLTLLSELDYRDIFIIENGRMIPPSSKSLANSIEVLFGLQERSERLKDFISSSYTWTYTNFIMQSFENPEVIESSKTDDPQFEVFIKAIKGKGEIKILDFGAGKGRIGKLLHEINFQNLEYEIDAYDVTSKNKDKLNSSNYNNLFLSKDSKLEETYDYVILSNTLHEIDPDNWKKLFEKIKNCLKDNGFLIFIEDLELPKGEKIDRFGFLVLNDVELGLLLNCEPTRIFSKKEKYEDRILCAIVQKNNINSVTKTRIIRALSSTKVRSYEKSKELRKENLGENGRLKAFYDSLYINSNLALDYYNK